MRLKALLLSLIMILSLSTMPVSYAADIADSSLDFISQLGITDGIDISNVQRYISRAEFTAMAVRMQNTGILSAVDSSFTDVTEETPFAEEIYTAKSLSLVSGTSEVKFSPDGSVTYGAAVKILIVALGYEQKAIVSGGYPTGYMVTASQIGLLKGISGGHSENITIEAASKLLYNALFTDLNRVVAVEDGAFKYVSTPGVNPLTNNFKLKNIKGIVDTAGNISSIPGIGKIENGIGIDGVFIKSDRDDLEKYLGLSCSVWYNPDNDTLYAVETTSGNKTEVINSEDVVGYSDNTLTVFSGDKTKRISISKGYTFVLNGRAISASKEDFIFDSGTLTLIDNDRNGKIDIVIAKKAEYFVVSSVNDSTCSVYDKNMRSYSISLKESDTTQHSVFVCSSESGERVKADYYAIKPNMTLMVYESRCKSFKEICVSDKTVSGTVDEYNSDSIIIDGISYKKNSYFKNNETTITPGTSGTFLIAADNTLTYAGKISAGSVQYGYFLDYDMKNESLITLAKMKILTSEGSIDVYDLCDKIKLDGVSSVKTTTNEFRSIFMNGDIPYYQLIRYSLDGEGKINMIDLAEDKTKVESGDALFEKYENSKDPTNSLTRILKNQSVYTTNGMAAPFFSYSGTVAFEIPSEMRTVPAGTKRYDDIMFGVFSAGLLDGTTYVDAFDFSETFAAGAITVYQTTASGSVRLQKPTTSNSSYIVEKVTKATTKDGDITEQIYLCGANGYESYVISGTYYDAIKKEGKIPAPGDIVRFTLNSAGEITSIARDVEFNGKKLKVNYGVDDIRTSVANIFTYVSGNVFKKTDSGFVLLTDNYPGSSYANMGEEALTVYRFSSNVTIIYDTKTGKVRRGKISDIKDAGSVGFENASYICSRVNYLSAMVTFVYE